MIPRLTKVRGDGSLGAVLQSDHGWRADSDDDEVSGQLGDGVVPERASGGR
jgi:hypothetical protein